MNDVLDVSSLKVGDEVGVAGRWMVKVAKVSRRTKTQIVVDGEKFNKHGNRVGEGSWDRTHLTTPEDARKQIADMRKEKARKELIRFFQVFGWHKLDDEKLAQLKAMLEDK